VFHQHRLEIVPTYRDLATTHTPWAYEGWHGAQEGGLGLLQASLPVRLHSFGNSGRLCGVFVIPEVLPAPNPWLGLAYFIPTVLELYVLRFYWKRIPSYPRDVQPKVRANILGAFSLVIVVAGVILRMIKW